MAFVLPLKETVLKFDYMNRVNELKIYNFFHISSRETLKEANYNQWRFHFVYLFRCQYHELACTDRPLPDKLARGNYIINSTKTPYKDV